MADISTKQQSLKQGLSEIPADVLLLDFHEASKDLQAAEIAVGTGSAKYQCRIDGNKRQLQVIQCEIKRRLECASDLLATCKNLLEAFTANDPAANEGEHAAKARAAINAAEGGTS